MRWLIAAVGALWIAVIMWDAFEAIVLPRRVTRRLRPARMFYRVTWRLWSAVARRMRPGGRRETFFSLGLGDVTPTSRAGRAVMVIEAGVGFGFLALVIGYLPVLYQSFSRRELNITLLDARAGSPPSAEELLRGVGADHEELAAL